jgi:hypothetical protein
MQHFYDGQIRRYITQIVRLMSNFSYKDGQDNLVQVPVMYGDITRQVAHIIRDNSENKIPSAPRIGVYVTGLTMDRERTSDSSFVSKVHLREREYDNTNKEYLNTQGKNYTVERLMPTPYTLTVAADIWATNTDQKLQILEQILMLFNPSLEIQTTDNYIDWTSLSVVNLDDITWSTRTIPVGTESDIDVATLTFSTPIYISPPVKVKKMGVITNVIMSIFNEDTGTIDLGKSMPELTAYVDKSDIEIDSVINTNADGTSTSTSTAGNFADAISVTTYNDYDLIVLNGKAQIVDNGQTGTIRWDQYFEAVPGQHVDDVTQIQLKRLDIDNSVNGTVSIDPTDDTVLNITWDIDTIPTNTLITGPALTSGTVDYIIDPTTFNPTNIKTPGTRLLILNDIGDTDNADGPDAWKGISNVDFHAGANDIIEWSGNEWNIVFDASETTDTTFVTNLNTGVQYKWTGEDWLLSFEGEYRKGTWRIVV